MTHVRHRDDFIRPPVIPLCQKQGLNLIFMDDNACPHLAHIVLQEHRIARFDGLARSPELNTTYMLGTS